jgi:hypothetical protein
VVRIDLPHGPVELDRVVVERPRDVAAASAGRSSAARDLSIVLTRALAELGTVALRRAELRTLLEVAETAGLRDTLML